MHISLAKLLPWCDSTITRNIHIQIQNCTIVLSQTLFSLMSKEMFQHTHSVMNNNWLERCGLRCGPLLNFITSTSFYLLQ